ncbi:MAG: family 1 extracellular solute-binding protein [Rhodospirillales bacterium]|nr:family 1 extracellular solute-binding protein [Rhodospirillales bacterium]
MRRLGWRSAPALGSLVLLVALGGAPRGETMDELYVKAQDERTLVLYGGGPVAPYEGWAREFEKRFPGITVSVTGGYSNVLNAKINQQLADHRLEADLTIFQTVQDFVRWNRQGVLLHFKPDGFAAIPAAFKDKDGAYMAVSVSTLSYAYNPRSLPASEVPRSALDFLKPKFRGKLITAYPHDDDATLYVFYTIVQRYGWGYMDKYMANQPNFIQGHLGVARAIEDGSNLVTFDATSATVLRDKKDGKPIELAFSRSDPTPLFTVSAAILKDAPHPNAAKLYLTWYLAKEQQSRTGGFSPRSDVAPPGGLQTLSSYKTADRYRELVADEKLMTSLRKRFEGYTGPVRNQGGVR